LALDRGEKLTSLPERFTRGKNPGTQGTGGWMWAPQSVWKFWRRENFLSHTQIQNPDRPASNVVATTKARHSLPINMLCNLEMVVPTCEHVTRITIIAHPLLTR